MRFDVSQRRSETEVVGASAPTTCHLCALLTRRMPSWGGCVFTRPSGAFEQAGCEGHVRCAPHLSLFERPYVDRAAVTNQREQSWLIELVRGSLVQRLASRCDDGVVEEPSEMLLAGEVGLDVVGERIASGSTPPSERKAPAIPSRGSPSKRPSWANRPRPVAARPLAPIPDTYSGRRSRSLRR